MAHDDYGGDLARLWEAVQEQLDERLDMELSEKDEVAIRSALLKAALRGYALGIAACELRVQEALTLKLDELKHRLESVGVNLEGDLLGPVLILNEDDEPFTESDEWAERYGSE